MPGTAERGPRVCVVADDYGLTEATSEAILDGFDRGALTATSVLVNTPAAPRCLHALVDRPGLAAGLHLALVGEDPPMSPAAEVPTLVDRRGRLARSWRHLLPRLAAGRVDPADVRRELEAQLDALRAAGVTVRHLNAHQHLQLWPAVGTVVVEAARHHGIAYVRTPRSARRGPRGSAIGALADRFERRAREAGRTTSEAFVGLDEAGRLDPAAVGTALARLRGRDLLLEVNVHPGADDDADRARYRWGYAWGAERRAILELPQLVADHGARMVPPDEA